MRSPAIRAACIVNFLATSVVIFFAPSAVCGQTAIDTSTELAAMRADVARIRTDQETVKSQLAQILRLLSQRPAQARAAATGPVSTSVADAPSLGRADAPVTIVEFSDYQCPFCRRFYSTTLAALKKDYIDAGKVRYVFRDYPLDDLHPRARKAAEAAHCAGEQGKYWQMHDALFQNQGALEVAQLAERARLIGLDGPAFDRCLSSGRNEARINRGLTDGRTAGVEGTPGFVIGRRTAVDTVVGTPIRGAQPLDTFRQIIEQLLAR